MADELLTAMVAPALGVTYCTIDGTPYRADATGLVDALARHIVELTALGFSSATPSQVPPGDDTTIDVGWAVAQ